jgi:peptide/nickel transport system substrate-binding protein
MAIDKQALVDKVLRGYGQPGTSIVPPRSEFWHWNPPPDVAIPFDIAGANKLLDNAGYKDTNGDGIREMPGGGQPLTMRLDIENEDPNRIKAARYVVGYLKQIGIQAKAQADTYNKTLSFWLNNDFDLYMWGWGPDPDPDFILSTFKADQCQVWSDTCWSNPHYDALYAAQQGATDLNQRKSIVDQMQQIIYQQNPEVVLYYDSFLEAYRSDRWTGFQLSPDPNGYLLNQYSPYSVLTLRPVSATEATAAGGGVPAGAWIAIVVGIIVIFALVTLIRRRRPDEDRA